MKISNSPFLCSTKEVGFREKVSKELKTLQNFLRFMFGFNPKGEAASLQEREISPYDQIVEASRNAEIAKALRGMPTPVIGLRTGSHRSYQKGAPLLANKNLEQSPLRIKRRKDKYESLQRMRERQVNR